MKIFINRHVLFEKYNPAYFGEGDEQFTIWKDKNDKIVKIQINDSQITQTVFNYFNKYAGNENIVWILPAKEKALKQLKQKRSKKKK